MVNEVVLVNGYPGSGKTTLARRLAPALGVPLLSKDSVKEALADVIEHPALGRVAMETVWLLAEGLPGRVVVESWWFRPRDRDHARRGLRTAKAVSVVEVWCDVPIALARRRYAARRRHDVHHDDRDMTREWAEWEAEGRPLALGPVIRVNTHEPVDVGALRELLLRDGTDAGPDCPH